jgi:hypothetical protein
LKSNEGTLLKRMKRKSQIKGLNPRRIEMKEILDCLTIHTEKKKVITRPVTSRTRKIVMTNAVNSMIFTLASILWITEPVGIYCPRRISR